MALLLDQMLQHRPDAKGAVGDQDHLPGAQEVLENPVGVADEGEAGLVIEHIRVGLRKSPEAEAEIENGVVWPTKSCMVEVLVLLLVVESDQLPEVEITWDVIMKSFVDLLWNDGLDIRSTSEGANALGPAP